MLPTKRRRLAKQGFLARLPAGDLTEWARKVRCATDDEVIRADAVPPPSDPRADKKRIPDTMPPLDERRKRSDMPVIRSATSGCNRTAMGAASSEDSKKEALGALINDMYAITSRRPRDALLQTWLRFHKAWFGPKLDQELDGAFPLTEEKLVRVSALFKAGAYKSYKNYLSRAKDMHLELGYTWTEALHRLGQRCTRSVLRGLSGKGRSEAFDFAAVCSALKGSPEALSQDGPAQPLAMIVCSTYFLLRELEASAVDVGDVSLSANSVTLSLPVSKTDWQAKGCRRTWSCLCSRSLICPFHVIKDHWNLRLQRGALPEDPLFPSCRGGYCSKQGVVDTIRGAVDLSGGNSKDPYGAPLYSGHTFRITGARYLSECGLDPITIQLLGRWGSDAVLTYLAEAPLSSMSDRISRPLERSSIPPQETLNDLDHLAHYRDALHEHEQLGRQMRDLASRLSQVERSLGDTNDIIEGLALTVKSQDEDQLRYVHNERSDVVHRTLISIRKPPYMWITACGWSFGDKAHANVIKMQLPPNCVECPKCFSTGKLNHPVELLSSSDD